MTDINEPIYTTSDGTFLTVVCENPEESVVGQKLGGHSPPPPPPPNTPPRNYPPPVQAMAVTPSEQLND